MYTVAAVQELYYRDKHITEQPQPPPWTQPTQSSRIKTAGIAEDRMLDAWKTAFKLAGIRRTREDRGEKTEAKNSECRGLRRSAAILGNVLGMLPYRA